MSTLLTSFARSLSPKAGVGENGRVTGRAKSEGSGYGRLDRTVILDAALRLAARPGVTEVRFRDLGAELGADPTAVYRHFRSKRQLMAALIDRLVDDVASDMTVADGYRELLLSGATALFDVFLAHPAIGLHLADARPVGPGELALAEVTVRALEDAGLSGETLIEHYGAFSAFVLSYVAIACREKATQDGLAIEGISWFPESAEVTPHSHPALARNSAAIAAMEFRSTYFSGVRVILDAVEAAIRGAGD